MKHLIKWGIYLLMTVAVTAIVAYVAWDRGCTVLSQELLDAGDIEMPEIRHATLLFGGDVMLHLSQVHEAHTENGYDFDPTFAMITGILDTVDLTIVNFETTVRRLPPYTGYPCFRSPAEIVGALKRAGVDAVMLANNHICDGGAAGIETTLSLMERHGIAHTGAFADSARIASRNPLYLDAGTMTVAILNYTFGTNGMPVPRGMAVNVIDTVTMDNDLKRVDRRRADIVCVMLHWGEEYQRQPDMRQKEIASFLRRRGVELVVGSHPHVIQPVESDSCGRWAAAYSLGNMVSNQQWRYSDGGMLLYVELTRIGDSPVSMRLQPIPIWVLPAGHTILPEAIADTLAMPPALRMRYERFKEDFYQTVQN